MCLQVLEQLRSNRANLKPPQLQMLEQLEAQLATMQQVKKKKSVEDALEKFAPKYSIIGKTNALIHV